MENNKQPGLDGIIIELYKYMDNTNITYILDILNDWWINVIAPQELFEAKVIFLLKKVTHGKLKTTDQFHF